MIKQEKNPIKKKLISIKREDDLDIIKMAAEAGFTAVGRYIESLIYKELSKYRERNK